MKGGLLEIRGATGAFLAAPLAGEMAGMRGGLVIVRGRAGERAGDRMRRGTIVILAAFLSIVLVGMVAFCVDIGYILSAKEDMQRSADSAALAWLSGSIGALLDSSDS